MGWPPRATWLAGRRSGFRVGGGVDGSSAVGAPTDGDTGADVPTVAVAAVLAVLAADVSMLPVSELASAAAVLALTWAVAPPKEITKLSPLGSFGAVNEMRRAPAWNDSAAPCLASCGWVSVICNPDWAS